MKQKIVIGIIALFGITTASLAIGQQPGKVSRVGYVATVGLPDANFDELRHGLRDLGHVEGKNITFEYRGAAVEAGALMSYGPSRAEVSRRAAV